MDKKLKSQILASGQTFNNITIFRIRIIIILVQLRSEFVLLLFILILLGYYIIKKKIRINIKFFEGHFFLAFSWCIIYVLDSTKKVCLKLWYFYWLNIIIYKKKMIECHLPLKYFVKFFLFQKLSKNLNKIRHITWILIKHIFKPYYMNSNKTFF